MRYVEVLFDYDFAEDYLLDVFVQGLADMGFESFADDAAYVQESLFDEPRLRAYAAENGQTVRAVNVLPDQNWKAAWEAEHPVVELPLGVRITPHCAFGAGYHETTAMMIDALLETDLTGKTVLDMGCGTGVLAIFAWKRGAARVIAVDIDDKSVDNTRENAEANGVTLDVRQGDTPPEDRYDLIMANIHRNILLAQMPDYARFLKPGGALWLSGFYAEDVEALTKAARDCGLLLSDHTHRAEWQRLAFSK